MLGFCNVDMWFDLGRLVGWGCYGVLRLWGGEEAVRSTLMVYAALMYEVTGKPGNKVQVIDI